MPNAVDTLFQPIFTGWAYPVLIPGLLAGEDPSLRVLPGFEMSGSSRNVIGTQAGIFVRSGDSRDLDSPLKD
jgi:hypothetical protein